MRKVFVGQTLCRLFYFWGAVAQPSAFTSHALYACDKSWLCTSQLCRKHHTLTVSGRQRRSEPCGVFSPQHRNISKQRISKSFRMIFFAHPHPLTPIESHSCKNRGVGVARTSVCLVFGLTEAEPQEIHRPEPEEDCVAGATVGAASLIKIGHRGNAKFPATSSITFTWQT